MQLDPPKGTGNGYPAFKWSAVGDTLAGEITSEPNVVTTKAIDPSKPDEENLVFEVRTTEGDDVTVWVPTKKQMYRALYEAVTASGGKLVVGGKIAIKFARTEPSKFPQPTKIYEVAYKAPATANAGSPSVDDLLG